MSATGRPTPVVAEKHIPALDGIRALAILLVIPHNADFLSRPYPALVYPFALVAHAGWIGVHLFFVLSGFLITGKLLDAQGSHNYFRAFFGRRTLRIMPLYFTVLLLSFVIAPALVRMPDAFLDTRQHQLWLWIFLSNWTTPFDEGVFGYSHFWSLAVEEQFYLIWPFVVIRCRPQRLLWICAIVGGGALLARALMTMFHFNHDALYMFTISRMDALATGAAVAALMRIPAVHAWLAERSGMIASGAVLALLATFIVTRGFGIYDSSTQTVGYTLLSVAFALVVLWAALPASGRLRSGQRVLQCTPLRLIGRYSYGMYIFHLPLHVFVFGPLLHRLVAQVTPAISLAYSTAMIVITFGIAALSYECFERRFLRLKRFLVPDSITSPTVARSSSAYP